MRTIITALLVIVTFSLQLSHARGEGKEGGHKKKSKVVVWQAPPSKESSVDPRKEFPLQWKVDSLDKNGHVLVDGKPFFPLGLFSCFGIDKSSGVNIYTKYTGPVTKEANIARLKVISAAGFNTLQTYTMQAYGVKHDKDGKVVVKVNNETRREGMLKYMDYCHEAGLKVMIGARHPYCIEAPLPKAKGARNVTLSRVKKEIKANIEAWKTHPALLYWYLTDEPYAQKFPAQDLIDVYRYVKTLDKTHPIWMVVNGLAISPPEYGHATDILAEDTYPTDRPVLITVISDNLDRIRAWQTRGKHPRPQASAIIQIGQWVKGKRVPTFKEMRQMSLLALTRDVKGLFFYEYMNYPEHKPEHWKSISLMLKSLNSVIPAILASSDIVSGYTVSDSRIECLMRRVKDAKTGKLSYYLIAVNPAMNRVFEPLSLGNIVFSGLKLEQGMKVVALDEDSKGSFSLGKTREIKLSKKGATYSFTDKFGKSASRIYRISQP